MRFSVRKIFGSRSKNGNRNEVSDAVSEFAGQVNKQTRNGSAGRFYGHELPGQNGGGQGYQPYQGDPSQVQNVGAFQPQGNQPFYQQPPQGNQQPQGQQHPQGQQQHPQGNQPVYQQPPQGQQQPQGYQGQQPQGNPEPGQGGNGQQPPQNGGQEPQGGGGVPQNIPASGTRSGTVQVGEDYYRKQERSRIANIHQFASEFEIDQKLTTEAVESGMPYEEFTVKARGQRNATRQQPKPYQVGDFMGMHENEVQSFQLSRAIKSIRSGGRSQEFGFEKHVSTQAAKFYGVEDSAVERGEAIVIPNDVLMTGGKYKRSAVDAMMSKTQGNGREFVPDEHRGFIDQLWHKTIFSELGVRMIPGLRGDVTMPKIISGFRAQYKAEGVKFDKSKLGTGNIKMKPHRCGGVLPVTDQFLMQQDYVVESYIWEVLENAVAECLEYNGFNGDGSDPDAPKGIFASVRPELITDAKNGVIDRAQIIAMEGDLKQSKIRITPAVKYLSDSKTETVLKNTKTDAGSGLFLVTEGKRDGAGRMNGYDYLASTLIDNDGTDQAPTGKIIMGDYRNVMVGIWGYVKISVDPYTDMDANSNRYVVSAYNDIKLAYPEGFRVVKGIKV